MSAEIHQESLRLMQYISDAVGTLRDPRELFHTLTDKLRLIFEFDSAVIITLDKDRRHVSVFFEMLRFELPEGVTREKRLIAGSWFEPFLADPAVTVFSIERELQAHGDEAFPVLKILHGLGMRQIVLSPLRSGGRVIGFLNFVSREENVWSAADRELLAGVSSPIAMAVSNAMAYEELREREAQTAMQLAVNNALMTIRDRRKMLLAVCEQINKLVPAAFLGIRVFGDDGRARLFDNFMKDEHHRFMPVSVEERLELVEPEVAVRESLELIGRPGVYSGGVFSRLAEEYSLVAEVRDKYRISTLISAPLWDLPGSRAGVIISGSESPFGEEDLATVGLILPQLSLALQNWLAFEEIDKLRRKLEGERTYLVEEISAAHNFEEIIGQSPALAAVQRRVSQVAPTDATVLIEGETGTGKELFARAIHTLSPRRNSVLVKVNCAALPATLIESELFGHEKGSFTGAGARRIGKFELADGGTIFLDEIGELSLELQAKMLRVLQERELERIGGTRVIPVDVRVIAATNRDLQREVDEGRFREDLFFRLNAFPIALPPLRERHGDIPMLVMHFASKFAREFGRPARAIRENDMHDLGGRRWKGNIRELAHVVEQAVIVSEGSTLDFSAVLSQPVGISPSASGEMPTMEGFEEEVRRMQRQLILEALKSSNGRVSGRGGAAERLDMHPKTLYTRIEKLGIQKHHV
ncbi:sigma-54-dependent Fis family transcriptional regulator [Pelodictyon luteolum]|uniref:DNA-binding protein Fis n=1 Tax=Chlorobium luteolum (strain DSM 273 / BCRC 81028 / 2530) TaxID=319225 RepID=Q3B6T3_CHLL3|nr:sigma 54-interacting transcriptional regulator [Pelodictyon luteolum]ABB22948.1 DNA-binding protein Fis [Pelodictyon luteolum DSM 273]